MSIGYTPPLRPDELMHYGMPRRSGRYPYGSGERPYQSTRSAKFQKSGNTYKYTVKGKTISKADVYDYKLKGFDWVLLANIETDPKYRKKGLATKLINQAYHDITKNTKKRVYLFVKSTNENAIRLYEKLNFNNLKTYKLNGEKYIIMTKGNADIKQFGGMNFS